MRPFLPEPRPDPPDPEAGRAIALALVMAGLGLMAFGFGLGLLPNMTGWGYLVATGLLTATVGIWGMVVT